jgi:hypothetical protein
LDFEFLINSFIQRASLYVKVISHELSYGLRAVVNGTFIGLAAMTSPSRRWRTRGLFLLIDFILRQYSILCNSSLTRGWSHIPRGVLVDAQIAALVVSYEVRCKVHCGSQCGCRTKATDLFVQLRGRGPALVVAKELHFCLNRWIGRHLRPLIFLKDNWLSL